MQISKISTEASFFLNLILKQKRTAVRCSTAKSRRKFKLAFAICSLVSLEINISTQRIQKMLTCFSSFTLNKGLNLVQISLVA